MRQLPPQRRICFYLNQKSSSALVTFVVVILVLYLVNMLPIDGRAKRIVNVIVIIIGIISLLKYLTVF